MSGVFTQSTLDIGGGLSVRSLNRDDWIEYEVKVASGGEIDMAFRVASGSLPIQFDIFEDGLLIGSIGTPTTNLWQRWKTVTTRVTLT